jgi:glycosyltransferase involved in cell wall biosynthesis
MNIFGLNPTSKNIQKFYIPHFSQVKSIYGNTKETLLDVKSVMFTRDAWANVDFWNSDADVMYVEDSLSWRDAMNTSGNHFDYFDGFLKIYRVAHSNLELGFGEKNDNHVHDIYANFLTADILWVSPIVYDRIFPFLKKLYCRSTLETLKAKTVSLPYPAFYKISKNKELEKTLRIHKAKPLVFLWNHRLVPNKNYKDFCTILCELNSQHPEIPFEIHYVCAEPEENIQKATPNQLKPFIKYVGFITDKSTYEKALRDTNITIATAKLESFGSSVFDAIGLGVLLLNQDCNDALCSLIGKTYTFSKKDMVAAIVKAYKSKTYREEMHGHNLDGVNSLLKNAPEKVLSEKINEYFSVKKQQGPVKSRVLSDALRALEKTALTKKQLFQAVGWNVAKNPVNAHWAGYYYALRRENVNISLVNGIQYFHLTAKPEVREAALKKKGLFS